MNKSEQRLVAYVAHPLAPVVGAPESVFWENIEDTKKCVDYLNLCSMSDTWPVRSVAPWIPLAEANGPIRPSGRLDRIMAADIALMSACDLLILIGNRISNGMSKELSHANDLGMPVIDLVDEKVQGLGFYLHMQKDRSLRPTLYHSLRKHCHSIGYPDRDYNGRALVDILIRIR